MLPGCVAMVLSYGKHHLNAVKRKYERKKKEDKTEFKTTVNKKQQREERGGKGAFE